VCVFVTLLLINALLCAQEAQLPLGKWNKLEKESPGTGIIVTLRTGEVITCFLKGYTADSLTVLTTDTQERTLPKSAVQKIVTSEKRSGPLTNGAIIGAAVPAAVVGGLIIAARPSSEDAGAIVFTLALTSGIGALIGLGIDAAVRGNVTLYQAPKSK
jgi:hypothetical protein